MARLETYTCDGCGAIKKEANHWWCAGFSQSVTITPLEMQPIPHPEGLKDYCGIECVQKAVSQWMAGLSNGK